MQHSSITYFEVPFSHAEERADHSGTHENGLNPHEDDDLDAADARIATESRLKCLYFLLGCTILLPWNVLVNGSSFFLSRLADSPLHLTFGSFLSSFYTLTKLILQFYCTITSKQSFASRRIYGSITAMIFLVIFLSLSTCFRGNPSAFSSFVLLVTASLAAAAACLCTAVYANAALLGPSFLQIVLSGHAAIAVVTNIADVASSLVSLWGLSSNPVTMDNMLEVRRIGDGQAEEVAARIFFGATALFLVTTLIAYARSSKYSFHEALASALEQSLAQAEDTGEHSRLLADERSDATTSDSHVYQVFKQNLVFMFSIAYSFIVTMALFPAITIRVEPVNTGFHPMLFTAIHFLVLNVGDFAGRYNCSSGPRHLAFWTAKRIFAMALIRTLFIPIILACNIRRTVVSPTFTPVIRSDILFLLIMLAFGYTQGYLLTVATLAVTSLEYNPKLKGRRSDVEVAATLSGALGIVGLASGSLASFAVQALV